MSGQVTKLDLQEVQKFKRRFAVARAVEIETASDAVGKLDKNIQDKKDELAGLTKSAKLLSDHWKGKEKLRLKKTKPGDPTQPEITAKEAAEAADLLRTTAATELAALEMDVEAARAKLVLLPREGYNEKVKAIVARLPKGSKSLPDTDATALAKLKVLLDARDYDGFDTRLLALEARVLDAVAATDLPEVHASLSARLATLRKQPVQDPPVLQEIDTALKAVDLAAPTGVALAKLERETIAELGEAEAHVQVVLDVMRPLDAGITLLERNGVEKGATHRSDFRKHAKVAATDPSWALNLLKGLEKEIAETQERMQSQADAKLEYPGELAALRERIKEFGLLTTSHESYKGVVAQQAKQADKAEVFANEKEFVAAWNILQDINTKLDGWSKAANDKEEKRLSKLDSVEAAKQMAIIQKTAATALAAQQLAQQQAAAAALAVLNQSRAAMDTASLDAIGKHGDFESWMDKLKALRDVKLLEFHFSNSYWLPGNTTVEVDVAIKGSADDTFNDTFVVHYHPIWDGLGSQIHTKPYTGNMNTVKDRRLKAVGHWIFGAGAPSLASVTKDFS